MNPLTFMTLVTVPFLFACAHVRMPADAVCYAGFTAIDPATERRIENAWVVVAGTRIWSLGSGPLPRGCEITSTHNLQGKFVLPGFIDAHAHITATGIQQIEVHDGVVTLKMESVDRITQHNARIALARGVTTIRNPGGDPEANARYDRNVAAGDWLGPEARHAGAVIEPPPFAGSMFAYPRNEAEWDAEAARQAALGMTYFKLYTDLTEAELAAGIRAAHRHGLKAIAHLNSVSWTRAAELGIDGLEHALPTSADLLEPAARLTYLAQQERSSKFMYRWFELADYDGPLIRRMVALLAEKKIPVNMTLVVNQLIYNIDDVDRIFLAQETADILPEVMKVHLPQLRASATGWTPEDFNRARAVLPKVLQFTRMLHEAGVPMMIGTDAGGGIFFGRELELHVQAGIPAWEVLRLATSKTASLLEMGARIGRIAPGFEADLVILDADPLADIGNAAQVHGVLNNGRLLKSADLRRR
jgi:imidazolonepropionase-like amidohydrolase